MPIAHEAGPYTVLEPGDLVEFVEHGARQLGHVTVRDGTSLTVRTPDGREHARSVWRVRRAA